MTDRIQVRRGTSAEWAAANPVLAQGEPGYDTTTGDFKIGDGVSNWSGLVSPYNSRYITVPGPWTPVTFQNGWVNFGGSDSAAQYQMVGDRVHLRGMIKTGTIGAAAFTLPAGFRPPASLVFATWSNSALGTIALDSGGVFNPLIGSNVSFAINCSFSVVA